MAANLLAHAPDLFACGIARSGAYNRWGSLSSLFTACHRHTHPYNSSSYHSETYRHSWTWVVLCSCPTLPARKLAFGVLPVSGEFGRSNKVKVLKVKAQALALKNQVFARTGPNQLVCITNMC